MTGERFYRWLFPILCALMVVGAIANVAMGAPFLVCDDPPPLEGVTNYVLDFGGAMPAVETTAPLHWDMAGLVGTYTLTARAKNSLGMSDPSVPFSFVCDGTDCRELSPPTTVPVLAISPQ